MTQRLSASAQRVQDALAAAGYDYQVVELPQTTRSAAEAAAAVGCDVGQIVKSLVFRTRMSQRPVLVATSGANRVNEKRLRELVGEPIEKADADFVRSQTGFSIGGVPPVGHATQIDVFVDRDLMAYGEIWAAAGNPFAVFRLLPADLVAMTGGRVAEIT